MPWSTLEGALIKCGVPIGISWVSLTVACTRRFAVQPAVRACMPLFWLSLALKWHLSGGRCCLLWAVAPVLSRGSPGKVPSVLLHGLGYPRCSPLCSNAASPSPWPWCSCRKAVRVRPRALTGFTAWGFSSSVWLVLKAVLHWPPFGSLETRGLFLLCIYC